MDTFLKACGGVTITLILCLLLNKKSQDISIMLCIAACAMVTFLIVDLMEPIMELFHSLEDIGNLDSGMIRIIIKSVGIGMIGEITASVCADSGLSAPGKALRTLTSTVILWMSVPLFRTLIELIQEILVAV